jgi:hypothetical protein
MTNIQFEQDIQYAYKSNIETRSCNHNCRAKTTSIAYSGCVYVALVMQYAKRMGHINIVIRGLSNCTMFYHIISETAWLSKIK